MFVNILRTLQVQFKNFKVLKNTWIFQELFLKFSQGNGPPIESVDRDQNGHCDMCMYVWIFFNAHYDAHCGKVQVSMGICAVWSGHSPFVNIYYSIHRSCKRTTKAQISLHKCTGWSGPVLSVNCIRALFVCCASYGEQLVFPTESLNLYQFDFSKDLWFWGFSEGEFIDFFCKANN